MHARDLAESHGEFARGLIGRVAFVELSRSVLARALERFPVPVRTLDALHLASFDYLLANGQPVRLASYDRRMVEVATTLDWPLVDLPVA